MTVGDRFGGVAVGLMADRIVGDPPNPSHPVAWFGTLMGWVESGVWADKRTHGISYAAVGVIVGAASGRAVRSTAAMVALTASGRQLRRTAQQIGEVVESGNLGQAREELPALVGRDTSELDGAGICAAVVESLAENCVDAVVATVFWGAVGGAPGAAIYRAINTMDAMVGHRNERFGRFGWAAARIDDVANYIPARLFALLVAIQVPSRARHIVSAVRNDAPAHPSPNAGVAEAAVAAALGCELGGPLRYGDRLEVRPTLGFGPRPLPAEVRRAVLLIDRTELSLVVILSASWVAARLRGAQ